MKKTLIPSNVARPSGCEMLGAQCAADQAPDQEEERVEAMERQIAPRAHGGSRNPFVGVLCIGMPICGGFRMGLLID